MEELDLAIIGAGWYGLIMASTYTRVNPTHSVLIFTNGSSIGGIWCKERLYPNLKSNNMLGTFEYSDFPMSTEKYGVKPFEHIPGEVLHRYLNDFAEEYDLTRRVRLESKVESVEEGEDGVWVLSVRDTKSGEEMKARAKRLVVATGMASEPSYPDLPGKETFEKPIFHFADCAKNIDTLETSKSVCILGGAKSAWDVAYDYATAGVQVEWIIRKSGLGPNWMAPPFVLGPLKKWLEKMVFTRFMQWFSPCIWGDVDGYTWPRRFLHGTAVGRYIVDTFWWALQMDVVVSNRYNRCEETKVLKPWTSSFFIGSMLSILNYSTDFFELVREAKIKVHIADIDHLSPGTVYLDNGEELKVDLLCCATGWKHDTNVKYPQDDVREKLGFPWSPEEPEEITARADSEILSRFPRLKRQPELIRYPEEKNPKSLNRSWRLFRLLVPPAYLQKRTIAFSGLLLGLNTPMICQAQAIWITAYLSGDLDLSQFGSEEDVAYRTELENRWGKWRYPQGFAARYPDFVFDTIPYVDMLMGDVGLKKWRKKSAFAEMTDPYGSDDYKGLVEEYQVLYGKVNGISNGHVSLVDTGNLRKRTNGVVKN